MRLADLVGTVSRCAPRIISLAAMLLLVHAPSADATDWSAVSQIAHGIYQSVNADGASSYSPSAFPIRLVGVVLNDNEDWLNPTSDYCTTAGHVWDMGGEAEFYVQAVGPNDFGGTACWIGQNYGNHGWHYSAGHYDTESLPYNHTEAEWYAELDRLKVCRPDTPLSESELIRAGDLVEIRAQAGLSYKGKMNVNENHDNDSDFDFEVVLLQKDYGLPTPTDILLSHVKTAENDCIFQSSRTAGGERYQSTLVKIQNVRLTDPTAWAANADLTLTDDTGRTLPIHLGLDASFPSTVAPTGYFNVIGVFDQKSDSGMDGYRLLAMDAGDFLAVPEPTGSVLLAVAAAITAFGWSIRRQRKPRV